MKLVGSLINILAGGSVGSSVNMAFWPGKLLIQTLTYPPTFTENDNYLCINSCIVHCTLYSMH